MRQQKKAEAASIKSVQELLGITEEDEKRAEKALEDGAPDVGRIIEELRHADTILKVTNRHLDDYVRAYESDPDNKEDVENIYTMKLRVLGEMARVFHPLSDYGRKKLSEIKKCSKEYEALVGPLVTQITVQNVDSFSSVLPPDMKEDIAVGRSRAIGALRTRDGRTYGAGSLVYFVEDSPMIDGQVVRIKWLYVHKDFRNRGIADHMLAMLMAGMLEQGIETMTIDAAVGNDMDDLKAYFMSSWQFEMEGSINTDAMIRVKDVTNYTGIREYTKGVSPITDLKGGFSANAVKNALKRFGHPDYITSFALPDGYFYADCSCYTGSDTTFSSLLLAHKLPSGVIRVDYAGCEPGAEKDLEKVVSYFIEKAVTVSDDDTLLYIPIETEQMLEFVDELCPTQMGQYLLEGLLTPPAPELNMDPEVLEKLMGLDENEIADFNAELKTQALN